MAGTTSIASRKRAGEDGRGQTDRFSKKRRRQQAAYHSSDSEDEVEQKDDTKAKSSKKTEQEAEAEDDDDDDDGFQAVDLLDSDDEGLNSAVVDDGASSNEDGDDSSDEDSFHDSLDSLDGDAAGGAGLRQRRLPKKKAKALREDEDEEDDDLDNFDFDDSDSDDSIAGSSATAANRTKRNDPTMFATSLQKILGTKLSTTRRADPVLSRSAAAREASRRVVDAGLAEKARRQMRLERRAALEKGRVKDVLLATNRVVAGDSVEASANDNVDDNVETTAALRETERRLRKVAQRGVVRLFNAVRAAQVQAVEAQRQTRADGVRGMDKRAAKVTEMSRKGFLDLIASGGGGLKKGGLEEA